MAGNPFSINIAQPDLSPVMTGLGSLIKEGRDKAKAEKVKQGLMGAYKTGDPAKVAEFISSNPDSTEALNSMLKFRSDKTGENYNEALRKFLANPTRENLQEQVTSRAKFVRNENGDPTDTEQSLEQFDADPTGFVQQAEMALATRDPAGYKSYKERAGAIDPEFSKEERKSAAQVVKSFDRQAKEMRTSYAKLQGLAEQARTGDRGAKNAMTVAVGRLMSPGIFTETEASALSGGQNSLQAIFAVLAGKGVDIEALQRNIDPYGDNFNVDGLLKIGSSIVASSRQPLIDMYESSRDRATRAGMGKRAFDTNFGENVNYQFLNDFGAEQAPAQEQAIQEGSTATNPTTGEKAVYTNGTWQPAP